jgi:hypothetical protein
VRQLFLLLALTAFASAQVHRAAADQYVSPHGNDSWDGTQPTHTSGIHGPVADICKARDNIRSLVGRKSLTVEIEDGSLDGGAASYFATPACGYPIAFTSADGGTSASLAVSYQNYPGHPPIFDGGRRVTGWSLNKTGLCTGLSNCYSVSLPTASWNYFEGLFYNGARRFRPRMGAGLSFKISTVTVTGRDSAAVAVYTTAANHTLQLATTVAVVGVAGGSEFNLTCSVTAVTSNTFSCNAPGASGSGTSGRATVSNQGQYYRIAAGCPARCASFNYAAGDPVSGWSNVTVSNAGAAGRMVNNNDIPVNETAPNDIEVYSFQRWNVSIGRISAIDAGSNRISITESIGTSEIQPGFMTNHRYILENARELFGQPGQWFLDRNTSPHWTLYYRLQAGDTDPDKDIVIVPQVLPERGASQLFTLAAVQWFTMQGLRFEHDNTVIPQTGFADHQLNPAMQYAVICTDCQHVNFLNNSFTQTMGGALDFQYTRAGCCLTITGNAFYDIGGNGLRIGSVPNTTMPEADVPTSQSVKNNYFAYGGRVYPSVSAVTFGLINHTEVANNTFREWYQKAIEGCMPRPGICGGDANNGFHDQNWHDNAAWNLGLGIADDFGCYYIANALPTGGAINDVMNHNLCHDATSAIGIDADGYGGNGFYLDSDSAGITVSNNLIYRTTGTSLGMSRGPNTNSPCGRLSNCQNVFQNNIAADARHSLIGVTQCAPGTNGTPPEALLQFSALSNFFYSRLTSEPIIQRPNGFYFGHGDPTAFQKWANNQYFNPKTDWATTGTPFRYAATDRQRARNWSCGDAAGLSWTAWSQTPNIPGTTGNEDAGSSIADPGFVHPYCTLATAAACAADSSQDNYSAKATPGLSPVPPSGSAIRLSGWGVTSLFHIPNVIDTFPIEPLNPSTAFCPVENCP